MLQHKENLVVLGTEATKRNSMMVDDSDTSMEGKRSSLARGARRENQRPQNRLEADRGGMADSVEINCESAGR